MWKHLKLRNTQENQGSRQWNQNYFYRVGVGVKRNVWFINCFDNVNWSPYRETKDDISSVSPSSEHIFMDMTKASTRFSGSSTSLIIGKHSNSTLTQSLNKVNILILKWSKLSHFLSIPRQTLFCLSLGALALALFNPFICLCTEIKAAFRQVNVNVIHCSFCLAPWASRNKNYSTKHTWCADLLLSSQTIQIMIVLVVLLYRAEQGGFTFFYSLCMEEILKCYEINKN